MDRQTGSGQVARAGHIFLEAGQRSDLIDV
jgi:hypothetical protein